MTAPVTLLMAIHCHQPIGNFGFVFEQAYRDAYEPFLDVLERYPRVRLALHYSGCLLDWLLAHRPAFVRRVKALAARGQVELLASGYYEPILPLLPEADRQGQIAQMRRALRVHAGERDAAGLWLTERVWEPDLPSSLARAHIRYTMVDVNQFAPARPWLPRALQVEDDGGWDLLGCYTTEHVGSSVTLFPSSKRLRYWLPFQPVERTMGFLKRLKGERPVAITFADDGEKFGFWPKTHAWVYGEGWLERFFTALEDAGAWLTTSTFRGYLEQTPPDGRVFLPGGSYEEMLEWSGGNFRNFFAKYPEARAMQQKMLRVSCAVSALKAQGSRLKARKGQPRASSLQPRARRREAVLRQAEAALYAGQCNCAYWHGVFGGLYLSHLRRAVYAKLLTAERLAQQASGRRIAVAALDADVDGQEEVSVQTPQMSVLVDPAEGGGLTEWSLYQPPVNLLDALTRRPEPYHEKLNATPRPMEAGVPTGTTPASIHDLIGVKEAGLASHLVYDDHRRTAFLDYGLAAVPTLHEVVHATWAEQRLWSVGAYQWAGVRRPAARAASGNTLELAMVRAMAGGQIRKTIHVGLKSPTLRCTIALDGVEVPVVGLEWTLSLRDPARLSRPEAHQQLTTWTVQEPGLKLALHLSVDPPATLLHVPIETVSESEEGLERTYQGLGVMCCWVVPRGRTWMARMDWTVQPR